MTLTMRKNIGLITILFLAILPIVRWVTLPGWNFRFMDLSTTMTSFGQIAGLVGMTLFSINLILSSRLKFLDDYFFGLNIVYSYHHKIGAVAFSLLLFHPLFLVIKYLQFSLRQAALFFLPGQDRAVSFGIIALALMIILLILTFYIRMKYLHWKFSHKFLVLVFIFAISHTLFISSDISRDNVLRYYILGLALLGLPLGFYRAFLSKFFNRNLEYKIRKISVLNPDIVGIEMESKDKVMKFQPGQFVFASFISSGISAEIHPFTISSAPAETNLKLIIKSLGDYTNKLKELKIGEMAMLEGPFGRFSYKNYLNKNQIWIAGGVGITPFISMAKSLEDDSYKIDLYYCTKEKSEAVMLDELLKISSIYKNFKIIPWYSGEQGHISGQKVSELSRSVANKEIFLCGPIIFMTNLRKQFLELKVSRRNIHRELFNFI
jgi:predicted ferric reductase